METTASLSFSVQNQDLPDHQDVIRMLQACSDGQVNVVTSLTAKNSLLASLQLEETGISPLMAAAANGHEQVCSLLLDAGAPWNAIDRKGQCAGNYATDAQHWNVVNLLVDAGTRAELILGASMRLQRDQIQHGDSSTKPDFLSRHHLTYNQDGTKLLDRDRDAVMMEWERPLMENHASMLLETPKRRVLNVGFGMGIIDTCLQNLSPSYHIIIEAHPDVYRKMVADGWEKKPNVRVCFGKWQEVIPQLIQEGVQVDGVFYDTYGEHFIDFEDFHSLLPKILTKPHGIYSFFNGLAPDNLFFHGVACQCVKLQLSHLGFDVDFLPCDIQVADSVWEGVRRKYWHGRTTYYFPRATWKPQHCLPEDTQVERGDKRGDLSRVESSPSKRFKMDCST